MPLNIGKKNISLQIEATMPEQTKCQNLFLLSNRKKSDEHRWSLKLGSQE